MRAIVFLVMIGSVLFMSCNGASIHKYSSRRYKLEEHMTIPNQRK